MVSYMHDSRHAINVGCIDEFHDSIVILKIPFRARTRRLQPIQRDTQKQVRPLKITALRQRSGLRQANMPIV